MKKVFLSSVLFFSVLLSSFGQVPLHTKDLKMVIAGTSNLHDWESTVTGLIARGDFVVTGAELKAINSLHIEIPIKAIKSSHGSIMDGKTQDALKAEKYPNITFDLTKVNSLTNAGGRYDIRTSGNLTISGVTRLIELVVTGKVQPDGSVRFEGSKKIKMTDHKVSPPTALMGTMKTGDEVTVSFGVTISK